MTMSDPIADLLTRIRNGLQAGKESVQAPTSRFGRSVLDVLKTEGYISDVTDVADAKHPTLEITLKYRDGAPVISEIQRISTPGLRQYSSSQEIPMTRNGLGITIVTTSQGVMTDAQARALNVGGEVVCRVF